MKKSCLFRRYERSKNNGNELKALTYTCHEVRILKEYWKAEFRKINGSDHVKKDLAYEKYCEEIEKFLGQCKCVQEEALDELVEQAQELDMGY